MVGIGEDRGTGTSAFGVCVITDVSGASGAGGLVGAVDFAVSRLVTGMGAVDRYLFTVGTGVLGDVDPFVDGGQGVPELQKAVGGGDVGGQFDEGVIEGRIGLDQGTAVP